MMYVPIAEIVLFAAILKRSPRVMDEPFCELRELVVLSGVSCVRLREERLSLLEICLSFSQAMVRSHLGFHINVLNKSTKRETILAEKRVVLLRIPVLLINKLIRRYVDFDILTSAASFLN